MKSLYGSMTASAVSFFVKLTFAMFFPLLVRVPRFNLLLSLPVMHSVPRQLMLFSSGAIRFGHDEIVDQA